MSASGQVTFSDVDASDTHSYSVSAAAAHGAASVDAGGNWSYTVSDSGAVDALAAGEHLADSFTVNVAHNHGCFATQVVTIEIVGTNDAPVITSGAQSGNVSEGDDLPAVFFNDTGTAEIYALSLHDALPICVSAAAAHGAASVDAGGNWSYTVSDSGAVDALAAGEHL